MRRSQTPASLVSGKKATVDIVPIDDKIPESQIRDKGSEDITSTWDKVISSLETCLDKQIFAAWIKPLSVAAVDYSQSSTSYDNRSEAHLSLFAPNKFCCDHVQRHYGELICSVFCTISNCKRATLSIKVAVVSRKEDQISSSASAVSAKNQMPNELSKLISKNSNKSAVSGESKNKTQSKSKTRIRQQLIDETNLNPRYNFSNYVVGGCNQFAHAACLKVSENLGHQYNPLFIYGGVGLGKTHLANAIGNAARRRNRKSLLISSETFVSELIRSLKTNSMDRFKSKFRSLDLLIIDDIQFIIGKERTQEEFFHTFNELHNHHKQIIITSDKIPQELIGLEERLRTRFASGLSADLQAPDFETRVAILNKKAESSGMFLPDVVAKLLAEKIDSNVRELEGALNRLQALSALRETEADLSLAKEVLQTIVPQNNRELSAEIIQKTVAGRYNVSVHDLLGKRRTHNIAFARQVAMYLSRRLTGCSYPELGALFGGRDHSTVIHANKVISDKS